MPIGCGALTPIDASTGEIKRMWVAPEARGLGVARRLLEAIENQARQSGVTRVVLDTNRALTQAQALYRKAGYRETERYNDNPYAHFWFEKELGAAKPSAASAATPVARCNLSLLLRRTCEDAAERKPAARESRR